VSQRRWQDRDTFTIRYCAASSRWRWETSRWLDMHGHRDLGEADRARARSKPRSGTRRQRRPITTAQVQPGNEWRRASSRPSARRIRHYVPDMRRSFDLKNADIDPTAPRAGTLWPGHEGARFRVRPRVRVPATQNTRTQLGSLTCRHLRDVRSRKTAAEDWVITRPQADRYLRLGLQTDPCSTSARRQHD